MKIIADSGSTKTQWALVYDNKENTITTIGLNPYHVAPEDIERVMTENVANYVDEFVEGVYFYGSGVTPQKRDSMKAILARVFGSTAEIQAESDMLGAARSLLGNREGIACILGTGANSCHYDGSQIVANTPAMGYILGDEGGGASIGKHLVNALYKTSSLNSLRILLEKKYGLTLGDIIEKVYRQPMANRFLASLAPFAKEHIDDERIEAIVRQDFTNFFHRNLSNYPSKLSVGFIGSIAFHFEPLLRNVAHDLGYQISDVRQSPLEGLVAYHRQ